MVISNTTSKFVTIMQAEKAKQVGIDYFVLPGIRSRDNIEIQSINHHYQVHCYDFINKQLLTGEVITFDGINMKAKEPLEPIDISNLTCFPMFSLPESLNQQYTTYTQSVPSSQPALTNYIHHHQQQISFSNLPQSDFGYPSTPTAPTTEIPSTPLNSSTPLQMMEISTPFQIEIPMQTVQEQNELFTSTTTTTTTTTTTSSSSSEKRNRHTNERRASLSQATLGTATKTISKLQHKRYASVQEEEEQQQPQHKCECKKIQPGDLEACKQTCFENSPLYLTNGKKGQRITQSTANYMITKRPSLDSFKKNELRHALKEADEKLQLIAFNCATNQPEPGVEFERVKNRANRQEFRLKKCDSQGNFFVVINGIGYANRTDFESFDFEKVDGKN